MEEQGVEFESKFDRGFSLKISPSNELEENLETQCTFHCLHRLCEIAEILTKIPVQLLSDFK